MKIGIFGDSFGYHHDFWPGESWVTLLKNDFDIDFYTQNGSSLFWSYKNLLENYSKYDKIIFLITRYNRIETSFKSFPSPDMAKIYMQEKDNPSINRLVAKSIMNYMVYAMEDSVVDEQYLLFHSLILEKIEAMNLDILFIVCFREHRIPNINRPGLYDITMLEQEGWGDRWTKYLKFHGKFWEERQCHMTEENNIILYNQVKNVLPSVKGNCYLDINLKDFQKETDFNKYLPSKLKNKI